LKEQLRTILNERSEEIATEWQSRIVRLTPAWEESRRKSFVQEMMTALCIYLLDQKLQAALRHIDHIIHDFFQTEQEGSTIIINSFLLNRYILLAKMTESGDSAVNSLEVFGFLNDLFKTLVVAVFEQHHAPVKLDKLPEQFANACVANLNALEFAGVGFIILDFNTNIIYWSRGIERISQTSAKESIGHNFFEKFPEWQRSMQATIQKALEAGETKEVYALKTRFNQKKYVLDVKVEPLHSEHEQAVGCSVLVHDVTVQKSRESQFHRYEQYFENILNDAADAIILLNENHRIIMWNKAAEHLFGYKEAEVFGKTLTTFTPDDKIIKSEMRRMDEVVSDKGFVRNQRTKIMTRDGRTVFAEITRTALRNDRNDFIGSSVILRDTTQQEQLRQQVFQSEKLSAVGTLAAGIAHEVGTPLTSISSLAQILQMKSDNPEFKEKLVLIQQSIDRISRTVRTLVDFSRPLTEKVEDIYLNNVIEHVIRILKYDKRLKHQEIATRLEPAIPLVRASFDQILQVFINICLNAADAMEGKKDGRLEVATWKNSRFVFASVTDNGCGIPKINLDHIFEPFFTTKKSGKGTGLGLWVSYNIISSFAGDIKVESKEDVGTTFVISIPISTS
jgi:PAS domain S-box-containing protein